MIRWGEEKIDLKQQRSQRETDIDGKRGERERETEHREGGGQRREREKERERERVCKKKTVIQRDRETKK